MKLIFLNSDLENLLKFLQKKKINKFTFSCKNFPFLYQLFITIPRNISNHWNQFMMNNDGLINTQRKILYITKERQNNTIIKTKRLKQDYICHDNKYCTRWQSKYEQYPTIGLSFNIDMYSNIRREYMSITKLVLKTLIYKQGLDSEIKGNSILISSERPSLNNDETI